MLGSASPPWIVVMAVAGTVCCPRPGYADVDLLFDPPSQTVTLDVDDIVEIDLVAHSSGGEEQLITALGAILIWDPASLELLGADDGDAGVDWFIFGFLPDPDDINEGSTGPPDGVPNNDGNAIYSALAPPVSPASVGPDDLVVTTLCFRALRPTSATVVQFLPLLGKFGQTRVFGEGKQNDITGDISATATVVIVAACGDCPTDVDGSGNTGASDLAVLLGSWGPCAPGAACECLDANKDGTIGAADLAVLLGSWGPCP